MTVRVAVVGNCITGSIANAIRVLSPKTFVQDFNVADVHALEPSSMKTMFEGFDLSLSCVEINRYAILNEQVSKINRSVFWPSIVFSGYHPDLTYFDIEGQVVRSCLGPYNSRIVIAAYACELSVEDTAERFNALTFGRLGYFSAYELGRQQFLYTARQHSLDLDEDFTRWGQSGPFMYTINHPKTFVVHDLARSLIKASGLEMKHDVPFDRTAHDHLSDGFVWPVYPEIARNLGIREGSYEFKPMGHIANPSTIWQLEAFIDQSFKRYAQDGFTPAHFRNTGFLRILGPLMGLDPRN